MRPRYTRSAAALMAVAAGGFAIYALRPADKPATLAARSPAVAYRTQVIHRTIHVIKHEHAARFPVPRGAVAAGGRGPRGSSVRTGASGRHGAAIAASGAIATRTSGSHVVAATGTTPVSTRTSGHTSAGGGTPAGAPTTRTSGAHGSSGSGGKPTTRSSGGGGGEHEGGDGGGD